MPSTNQPNPKSEIETLRSENTILKSQVEDLTKKLEASEKSAAYHKKEHTKHLAKRQTFSSDPSVN